MKHWFYTEDGKPKSADSFEVEQMKQFLEEFGDKITKVGDEITKELHLYHYTEPLTGVFNYLKIGRLTLIKHALKLVVKRMMSVATTT